MRAPRDRRVTRGRDLVRRAWQVGPGDRGRDRDDDAHDPHEQQCRKLLLELRRHCPGYVPPDPLPPGKAGDPVTVRRDVVERLVTVAAIGAAGIDGPDGEPTAPGVVWVDGDSELFVRVPEVRTAMGKGAIAVTIPVSCDEIGDTDVHVTFAVGTPERPLGMVAAAEERPRGPRAVVDVWGAALTAFAWQVVLDVAAGTAAHAGDDQDGAFLLPAAIASSGTTMIVLPQARHTFDRVIP